MRKNLATLALLVAAPLALAACSEDAADAAPHNEADVTFAQEMIPHHQQAVEMAALAGDRAADPEVRELAADIAAAQEPEIATMTGWLEAWGEDVPAASMEHGDMGHGSSSDAMPGMMTAEEMADLEQAEGTEFDRMFLEMMVEHHSGALEMARTEQAEGENPDAVALAEKIESDQETEIAEMQRLLES
jgi:uncharacterized protein (DUF305 family)